MYYEIPFLRNDRLEWHGGSPRGYLQTRLSDLGAIVDKLEQEGWFTHLTLTGVAFSLTGSVVVREKLLREGKFPTDEEIQAFIRQKFIDLGIQEKFRLATSRSLLDIHRSDVILSDRVWYEEAEQDLRCFDHCQDEDAVYELRDGMRNLERLYGRRDLIVADSYERGLVHGRLQALRWVLGAEWSDPEFTDTGDDRVDAECEKDERIEEEGKNKLRAFLTGKANTEEGLDEVGNDNSLILN